MIDLKKFKSMLLVCASATALVACGGDSSTEIASPGQQGPNPGTGVGGGDNSGGGDGGGTVQGCPEGTTEVTLGSGAACEVSGEILSDLTLTSDNTYLLSGRVVVGANADADGTGGTSATLTVEPGTTIAGADASSFIVVTRGSRIEADGSAANPIIFTSAADVARGTSSTTDALSESFTSEWGGIVINGLATLNRGCDDTTGVCELEGEADSGLYGGTDDADNSGTLRYVQVRYAGNPITADDELNGIAFQGVGSGTTLDFIHVHNGADDGVEFFGGTAQVKHLIITGADDDSLDWTNGWRGKAQHVLILHNENQPSSDQGIEADSNSSDNDATPRARPQLSNFTIIGAQPAVSDIGILLREGTGAQIWNTVVSNFEQCLDIDGASTYAARDGADGITMESTYLTCDTPFRSDDDDADLEAWFLGQPNNSVGSPTLSGFVNGVEENAVTATDPSAVDSFFDSVDYIGAVRSADSADNWTLGWSYGINPDATCPSGTTDTGAGGCILEGTYTGNIRLVAGLDYFLRGRVTIGEDVGGDAANPDTAASTGALTIDAGVQVMGEDATSFLVVSRGSQLFANGTADAPVVFTATDPETRNLDTDTSLWGGLVINGRATLNRGCTEGSFCELEGEADSGLYGGNDDTDNSGNLIYTRVEYAGNPITSDDELNGIAFQGVGNGTTVDFVQVHNGADDGVEFFGGTVNVRHLVVTGADDDHIDWTNGWRGKMQYAVVVGNANQPSADQGIEADSNSSDNDATPRAQPLISNITLVGAQPDGTDIGILLREGTGARIYNSVVTNWEDCLDIDGASTYAARDGADGIVMMSVLLGCDTPFKDDEDDADLEAWFLGQANNSVAADTLTGPGSRVYINGATESAVTATDVTGVDSFFEATDFIGAVRDADSNWLNGWTVWIND